MAKFKAKLRSMDLRGEAVTTRWGLVRFSQDGLADLEVDEDQLPLLRDLKWLVEAPVQAERAPAPAPAAPPATAASEPVPAAPGGEKPGKPSRR